MSDETPDNTEADASIGNMGNTLAISHEPEESSPIASLLLKLWNLVMIISTAVLCFFVFVLKDNSVMPFVALGIIGLCLPPVVGMFRSMARDKQRRLELELRMEEARQERIKQARERELERMKREKMLSTNEQDIQQAIKNVDVASYKANNGMESSAGGL